MVHKGLMMIWRRAVMGITRCEALAGSAGQFAAVVGLCIGLAGGGGGDTFAAEVSGQTAMDRDGADDDTAALLNEVLGDELPLQPDDRASDLIKRVQRRGEAFERGVNSGPVAKGVEAHPVVRLEPGQVLPAVETEVGYITTLVFVDSTGERWAIKNAKVSGGKFDMPKPADGAHVISIEAKHPGVTGNLSVQLQGLTTPVVLTLQSGNGKYHQLYTARIAKAGPLAKAAIIQQAGSLVAGSEELQRVAAGISPSGGRRMSADADGVPLDGGVLQAWAVGDTLFVKTAMDLLSPKFLEVVPGEGSKAYVLKAVPYLWFSDANAVQIRVHVTERRGTADARRQD
jgi:intracellular multiplication protein IcmK